MSTPKILNEFSNKSLICKNKIEKIDDTKNGLEFKFEILK
tara:strand:+ start:1411 stop:1530 length:120 start_codon:yes stop_codon:yes gene_type:complete